jgi:hypothetical protein
VVVFFLDEELFIDSFFFFLGVLTMLFAEVFSRTSTLWFVTPRGVLPTLSLYLGKAKPAIDAFDEFV